MLVAADSLQIHANPFAGYGVTVDKLAQMGEEKIVWGYWGQVDGGTKLAHRLAQETFADWDALSDWVSEQATDLNGENPPFGALFAGWLGGQRKASAFGDQRVLSGDDFMFCGNGCVVGKVGWQMASHFGEGAPIEERFDAVMTTTIGGSHPTLGLPLNMWRITETESPLRIRGEDQPNKVDLGG
jgi:hypothetical protein